MVKKTNQKGKKRGGGQQVSAGSIDEMLDGQ